MPSETVQIRAIGQDLNRTLERVVRKVTLDITANLIRTTPVDTGWARANWIPRIGRPVGRPAGTREAVNTAEQAAGQASIASYRLQNGTTHVTNNVPYINRLNMGHSRQAPAGFVQGAIRKAVEEDLRGFRP